MSGSRFRTRLALIATIPCSVIFYIGCSGDDDDSPTTNTPDSGADSQVGPNTDTGAPPGDTGAPDTAKACADTTFDCSANAGDAGLDGGPPSTGADDVFEAQVPVHLRCTGLYSCWSDKTVAAATHREYTPGFTLWSDGAEKTRWVVLPPNTKIDTGTSVGAVGDGGTPDEWVFPNDTMVYKEFKLGTKRIETRRIWKASATKWVYSVWRWNADESDAVLTYQGELVPNTAIPNHMYEVPATTACAGCHDGHRDKFLSLDAWGLGTPTAKGVTLATLKADQKIVWDPPTSLAPPQDATGKLDQAIGFYYNNCGFCHKPGRPGGAPGLHLYLPVAEALTPGLPDGGAGLAPTDTPLYKTAVDIAHTNTALYPAGTYKRIFKGDATHSVLPLRDSIRDPDGGVIAPGQMPTLLQRTVDPTGVPATQAWINALQ